MKRVSVALGVAALAAVTIAAGCGGGAEQPPSQTTPAPAAPGAAASQDLNITFTSNPAPPKTGENTLEVMVMDENGQPVTDANVSVEFYMAAMPSMNMPEMRNRVDLAHESGGRYRGTGNVMMAGGWDVTVTVSRGGQTVDSEKLSITAQ
jgi:nitrogen fixation protein FixH